MQPPSQPSSRAGPRRCRGTDSSRQIPQTRAHGQPNSCPSKAKSFHREESTGSTDRLGGPLGDERDAGPNLALSMPSPLSLLAAGFSISFFAFIAFFAVKIPKVFLGAPSGRAPPIRPPLVALPGKAGTLPLVP